MHDGFCKITVQKPNRKHLFVAVPVTLVWQHMLHAWQSTISNTIPQTTVPTHWIHPSHFHLTLRYLGTIEQHRVPGVITRLRELTVRYRAFSLPFLGIEYATPSEPKMIWARFEPTGSLHQLVGETAGNIGRMLGDQNTTIQNRSGYQFIPHVTLARAKGNFCRSGTISTHMPEEVNPLPVTALTLFETIYFGRFHEYKALATFQLRS